MAGTQYCHSQVHVSCREMDPMLHAAHISGRQHSKFTKSIDEVVTKIRKGCTLVKAVRKLGPELPVAVSRVLDEDGVRLQGLGLHRETIDASFAEALSGLVGKSDSARLRFLQVTRGQLSVGAMGTLGPALVAKGWTQRLTGLCLIDVRVPESFFRELGDVLLNPGCRLETLHMKDCLANLAADAKIPSGPAKRRLMGSRGEALARGIGRNRSLRYCTLGDCWLDPPAMLAWVDALQANDTLRQLDMGFSLLGPKAHLMFGECLGRMIAGNRGIQRLLLKADFLGILEPRDAPAGHPTRLDHVCRAIGQNTAIVAFCVGTVVPRLRRDEGRVAQGEYLRLMEAVASNPRIVYFGWYGFCTYDGLHARRVFSPRLLAFERRKTRLRAMVRFRWALAVHRDARLMHRAAAEGRPLELQRRVGLGVMGGGHLVREMQGGTLMTALEAATAGGHAECKVILRRAVACEEKRRRLLGVGV